ncbi:hypothetical protein [Desulfotruncus alcoholivorax]|uniref:hypothetical protein n=1 Tax=Desulfotruncus alcoholivorax TaxID=265477 RepID=UPI0004005822|nr:hypothetical protein [Desulfotruncus alcoholivorax]
MNNPTRFVNPLILFLMPVLFGIGIHSLSYETRRFAILPAGNAGKSEKAAPAILKPEGNQIENEGISVVQPDTVEQDEGAPIDHPDKTMQNEATKEPPAIEVATETPPKALPTIRYNRK